MEPLKLKFESKVIDPKELRIHPMLIKLGLSDDRLLQNLIGFYASEIKYHGPNTLTIPITNKGQVLGNVELWRAALINKEELVYVQIIEGLEDDDILRYINTRSLFFRRSYKTRWLLFREMKEYLNNTEKGKLWMEEIKSKYHVENINQVLQVITGYSASSIKQIQKIGLYSEEHCINLFQEIGYHENQESLASMCRRIQNNEAEANKEKSSEFPLSPEEVEKENEKQKRAEQMVKEHEKNTAQLMGNENLDFTLKWKLENKVLQASAPPALHFKPEEAVYRYSISPELYVEIKIKNISELFKLRK